MRMKGLAFMLGITICGCAWIHGQARPAARPHPATLGWATIEIDQVEFVGPTLNFRVLVGATDGGVVLDRRLIPNTDVELKDARDCDAGGRLTRIFVDFFPEVPGPSDLLELRPGEWFGRNQQFPIFLGRQDGGGIPECVDATFVFRPEAALNDEIYFHVKGSLTPHADAGLAGDAGD